MVTKQNYNQLMSEIYSIVENKKISIMTDVIRKAFPKSKGSLQKLKMDEIQVLIPLLHKAYANEP